MNFRNLATVAIVLCVALTLAWLCASQPLLASWGVAFSPVAALLGRRAAALFAGIGAMFYLARNEPPSKARNAIAGGFGVACLALACLGTAEFMLGHAGWGILTAAAGEIGLAAGFLYVALMPVKPVRA